MNNKDKQLDNFFQENNGEEKLKENNGEEKLQWAKRGLNKLMLITATAVSVTLSSCQVGFQGSYPLLTRKNVVARANQNKARKKVYEVSSHRWLKNEILETQRKIRTSPNLKEKQEYLQYLKKLIILKGQQLNIQEQEEQLQESLWERHQEIDFNVTTGFDRKSIIWDVEGRYTLDNWEIEEIPNKQDGFLLHLKLRHHKRSRWTKKIQLKLYYNGRLLRITTDRGKTYSQVVNRGGKIVFSKVKVSGGKLRNLQFTFANRRKRGKRH